MPTQAVSRQIERRLGDLHDRHLHFDRSRVSRWYTPQRGLHEPDAPGSGIEPFAISLATTDGELYEVGDHTFEFALQSISKVFAYGLALEDHGREHVMRRVGVEPSGEAFNSIVFDETNNRPFNPMVNAGALVVSDLIRSVAAGDGAERVLEALRAYAANPALRVDDATLAAELRGADRNRATVYLMRSQGMVEGDVEDVLDLYLRQCSVHVTTRDLAVMGATLAAGGVNPITGGRVLRRERVRDVLSVMYTCGMYDFAGEWAFEVGVPAKSGVSGGIVCVIPGKLGIAVFSPGLDRYGNSVRAVDVCKELSERLGLHVFASDAEDAMMGSGAPA